ncbi:hypothetical protein H6503_00405 [Candidatus Woesearchaeota archaeon]|nr:hypothetical protein [Candidatus Woesearchaeota archaeon]
MDNMNIERLPCLEEVLQNEEAYKAIVSLSVFDRARWAIAQGKLLMTTAANETSEAIPTLWHSVSGKYPKMYFTNHGLYPEQRWNNLYNMMEKGMDIEILNLGYTEKDVEREYGKVWLSQEGEEFEKWRREQKHAPLNEKLAGMEDKPIMWVQGITDWREDRIIKRYNGLVQFYPFVDMTKSQLKELITEMGGTIYGKSDDVAKSPHTKLECGNRQSIGMFEDGAGI